VAVREGRRPNAKASNGMSRLITYSKTIPAAAAAPPVAGRPVPKATTPNDDYAQKLVKYVPGEAIAFYTPLAATLNDHGALSQFLLVGIGLVGAIFYTYYHSRALPAGQVVLPHYYVLSALAFIVWAANLSPQFGSDLHLDLAWRTIALASAVFLFPGIDQTLADAGV
jgi:hypothetical protein